MVSALNIIGSDRSLQEHWLKRFVAILIDSFIIYVIGSILMQFAILPLNWSIPNPWVMVWPPLSGVMLFIYSLIMEASGGAATLGKRIMGLRVIAMNDDMDTGKAAIRNLSKVYALFFLLDWLVGFTTEGDPKQKWMDRVAGTSVVVTSMLSEEEQHTYQTQQSKYAPPPQEPYPPTRHEQVYQYPPPTPKSAPPAQDKSPVSAAEVNCAACGGRMAETGTGRLKCIRCGKIQ
ncbi:MAG: RDD family protein [Thermoplasmata archaeon]